MTKFLLTVITLSAIIGITGGTDILTAGKYSFSPGKIYCGEQEVVSMMINGCWAKNPDGKYYSLFKNLNDFSPWLTAGIPGRAATAENGGASIRIVHLAAAKGIIINWNLVLPKRDGGGGELGIFIPGFMLEENSSISIDRKNTGTFSHADSGVKNLGRLAKSGTITIKGKQTYEFNIRIDTPDQIHGVFVQKWKDGIRVIASYNFSNGNKNIALTLSMGINEAPEIDNLQFSKEISVTKDVPPPRISSPDFELVRPTRMTELSHDGKTQAHPVSFVANGEKMRISLKRLDENAALPLSWRLVNESGALMEEGKLYIDEKKRSHEFVFQLTRNGCYRLEVFDENGRMQEALFSVFPPLRNDSVEDGLLGSTGVFANLYELARICGLTWHRWHCGWVDTRAEKAFPENRLNREYIDYGLKLDRRAGFNVLGSLMSYRDVNAMTDAQYADFLQWWIADYVPALTGHLKGNVLFYEVFNEPYYTFRAHIPRYVEMLKATNKILKQANPAYRTVGVCGPPNSMGFQFYQEIFELGGLDHMDVLSFHQYCFASRLAANPETSFIETFDNLRNLCRKYGKPDIPIWNSESSMGLVPTLYTLPENLAKIRNAEAIQRINAREQAAVFSRILTVHYAYRIKFFFHLFAANSTYNCHVSEFDGSPLPLAVAMAATQRRLEGTTPLGNESSHPQVWNYRFQCGNKSITVLWLRMQRNDDKAVITIPAEVKKPAIYDFLGNPLDIAGNELAIGPEPVFIEYEASPITGSWPLKVESDKHAEIDFPAGVKPASAEDWGNYYVPVDLSRVANRGFSDDVAGDRLGGFTDEGENDLQNMPVGNLKIGNVPYRVLNPADNQNRGVVVLRGYERDYFPASVTIPLKDQPRFAKLHILHLCTYGYRQKREQPVYRLNVLYSDGFSEKFDMLMDRDIKDWYYKGKEQAAFHIYNTIAEVAVFQKEITLGHPRGASAKVKEISLESPNSGAIPVIIAMTGVLSN